MQCSVCHKEVNAQQAFCASCGAPVAASAAPPTAGYTAVPNYGAPAPGQPAYVAQSMTTSAGLSNNTAAALSYVTIIPAIIFLVLEPYNKVPLIRFHSWQSIFLFLGAVVLQFAVTMLHILLHFIPLVGILFALVHFVLSIGLFIVWLIAILKASKGEWYKIPVIGDLAEKQARHWFQEAHGRGVQGHPAHVSKARHGAPECMGRPSAGQVGTSVWHA